MHIQFFFDDRLVLLRKLILTNCIEFAERLTDLEICLLAAGKCKSNDLLDIIHVTLEFLIDPGLICYRIVAHMDRHRSILIHRTYEILVDGLCHERDKRSSKTCELLKCSIKRHECIDLILCHISAPVSFTAAAYIPVRQVIYKCLH